VFFKHSQTPIVAFAQEARPSALASFPHRVSAQVSDTSDNTERILRGIMINAHMHHCKSSKKRQDVHTHTCTHTWCFWPVGDRPFVSHSHRQQQRESVSPWLGPAARADSTARLFVFMLPKQTSEAGLLQGSCYVG